MASAAPHASNAGLRPILFSKANLLLLFLPLALAFDFTSSPDTWVFASSALSVVPLARLIGQATEQLSLRSGPGIGGLLNATFGNGAELLIAGFALSRGLFDVVKASVSGSIISNILLVLGLAILAGGWGRERQRFSRTAASAQLSMLFLAVVALVMPAVYDLTVEGNLTAATPQLQLLSLLSAFVLLGAYVAGLFFSLRTHRDVFTQQDVVTTHAEAPTLSVGAAVGLLAFVTALTAVAAELLSGSVDQAAHALGLTDLFVGMIVLAIVGNAAEQTSAIFVARKGNIQLAVNIAKASSVQLALLVAPLLILFSWVLGTPMSLIFHPLELFGIALAVAAVALVIVDGESNWYEGVLLVAVYVLVAIAVYFVPG